ADRPGLAAGTGQSGATVNAHKPAGRGGTSKESFMGQKIRPTGFRTGIMVGWASQWYANKKDFSDLLVEDVRIRAFVEKFLTRRAGGNRDQRPGISKIRIDRTREKVVVTIYSA